MTYKQKTVNELCKQYEEKLYGACCPPEEFVRFVKQLLGAAYEAGYERHRQETIKDEYKKYYGLH